MEAFPTELERTVAAALLLLSITPPSSPLADLPTGKRKREDSESLELDASVAECDLDRKSPKQSVSTSTLTAEDGEAHHMKMIAVVSEYQDVIRLKVVRKRRSKSICVFDGFKNLSGKSETSGRQISTADSVSSASCVSTSSGSSAVSSGRSRDVTRTGNREKSQRDGNRKEANSAHLRRQAEAIMSILFKGCASEVRIRQLIGDSPSTSKALRMLLKLEKVKRTGAGGRSDPFIYKIA